MTHALARSFQGTNDRLGAHHAVRAREAELDQALDDDRRKHEVAIAAVLLGELAGLLRLALELAHDVAPVAAFVEDLEGARGEDAGLGSTRALRAFALGGQALDRCFVEPAHPFRVALRLEAAGADQVVQASRGEAEKPPRRGRAQPRFGELLRHGRICGEATEPPRGRAYYVRRDSSRSALR